MSAPSTLLLKLTLRLLGSLKARVDQRKIRERGFVLPVAILIVLVLSLVTVGLLTRSTQRSIQTQVERAGQTISRQLNTAIDRARAKIDYLVRDPRLPNSAPTDAQFAAALINDGAGGLLPRDPDEPYILPDETQFVIATNIQVEDPQNPGQNLNVRVQAPAWWFLADTDNNGINDSVTVYTILNTRRAAGSDFEANLTDTERARRLLIRSGPLQGSALAGCTDSPAEQTVNPNVGDWFQVGSALYKPFQVYAVTLPIAGADSTTRAISALQFQQDRRRDLLNKWGAFSRGDLEYFFTPGYNWNGAIYAGGSLFFRYASNNLFRAFTISSEQSCFYMPVDNSEITAFGELVAGAIGYAGQDASDTLIFDAHPGVADVPPSTPLPRLNNLNFDSVQNTAAPEMVALDPLELQLFGRIRTRGTYAQDPAGWSVSPINVKRNSESGPPGRVQAGGFQSTEDQVCPPYVDDVYRADNRFGPKASYDRPPVSPDPARGCDVDTFTQTFGVSAGAPIPGDAQNNQRESLTQDNPPPGALSEVGLDGYWERRARVEGLRVIVGQRLELTRTDSLPLPLVPTGDPNDPTKLQPIFISNEARQRLTLRDNPAAVQATAVYHHSNRDGRFPIACLATVAHPGSPWSLQRASTFPTGDQRTQLGINFFTGQGTNVWEYDPTPMQARLAPGTPLWTALTNLANFAGDPDGAYPPRQEAGRIHPDPFITAFGNFSELRRVIDIVNRGTSVDQLSLADQTTLQTAGCMLGMLADNMLRIEAAANAGDPAAQTLWNDIQASRAGNREAANRFYLPLRYIFPTTSFNQTDTLETERRSAYSFLPSTVSYQAVTNLNEVALEPRSGIGNWALPHAPANCTAAGPNSNQFDLIRIGNQCHRVPFKDSVFYDGREAMAVRALNIDLALLTNNVNGQDNGLINRDTWRDTWLPAGVQEGREGGIFYAFREDAVREDAIARPPLGTFDSYLTSWRNRNARGDLGSAGVMNAGQPNRGTANGQTVWDPPVSEQGLSPKPVDYYADPDRRPYGFRLRNGAVLARGGFSLDRAIFGLSFVSDNPVYIQGDFNLHQTRNGDRLEEFTTLLNFGADGLYSNFYGRLRSNEDRRFARAAEDLWRPSDVLGDSVNILSADFCDGSLDDGFVQDGTLNGGGSNYVAGQDFAGGRASAPRRSDYYGCSGPNLGANTSFLNQALVIRGNNWPAPDPDSAGVLRFDNTNGAQNLGDNTNQPGWPDVFARDTIFARRNSTDASSGQADRTAGLGVPEVRLLRAPDTGYANFGVRISALGNPVLDTSRWVLVAPLGPCPDPGGSGLLAEYYNGWLSSPQNQYDRNTGFADPNNPLGPVGLLQTAQNRNLPYLRAVRWPDPIFPVDTGNWEPMPDAIGQYNNGYTSSAPTCNPNGSGGQRWACVRDAISNADGTVNPSSFARSGPGFPWWGGFQYRFGRSNDLNSNSPFKRRLYNSTPACNSTLIDTIFQPPLTILQPLCRLSVPILSPPNLWEPRPPFNPPDPSPDRRDRGDWFWMPSCGEPDGNNGLPNAPIDADDIGYSYKPVGNPRIGYRLLPNGEGTSELVFNNPNQFNFLRSCWRRRSGGSGSGNNNGNDFFVVRWVGELYPRWPGLQSYRILNGDDGVRLIIRRRDGSDATFENRGVWNGTPLNLGPNAAGAEAWLDSGSNEFALRLELECADPSQPSPYLVEIQTYENTGSASLRFATRDDSDLEDYDLRYLKPLQGVNKPCQPDPIEGRRLDENRDPYQRSCATPLNCAPRWTDWTPACDPNICQQTTIIQTRTATLPAGCPGTPPTPQTRRITCDPQYNYGPWSDWTPQCTQQQRCSDTSITQTRSRTVTPLCRSQSPFVETDRRTFPCRPPEPTCTYTDWTPQCTVADGGQTITQSRTVNCTSSCGTTTTIENRPFPCPRICNYSEWSPWSPPDCSQVRVACGQTTTVTQTRTRNLIASTSSPTCPATETQTQNLTCQGPPCGPSVFAPETPSKSPLGEWMAAKPNTVELRPVHEIQADPEPETIGVNTVAKASTEGVTIALEPQLSPVLEVKAGVPKPPKWPNPAEALQAAFNWMFGEPAYAARAGLRGNLLSSQIANPSKEPGIRPAESGASPISGTLSLGTDDWARQLRRRLLNPNGTVRCDSEEKVTPTDGGFWVPGVFRPNFNDRFKYTAYTAASRPSTLRIKDWNGDGQLNFWDKNSNGVRDSDEPWDVLDRDPLFGLDLVPEPPGNPIQLEIQPQMVLNPYARVNKSAATQAYTPASKYADGYYINHEGSEDIRNGLCFYVKPNGNTIQVQVDRDGGSGNKPEWVDVEPFTLDLNKPTTGFAGNNPVLGVILDEVTRRPIPIPRFQELASADVNQRRRNDNGTQNRQLQPARETRVNAIAISGVIPSRLNQTGGGMHNFLRLNELWRDVNLFFSGSMIQLNYSTYATGPFLQHSFEPPNLVPDPTSVRGFDYYFPPNRRFGYDVGLQIARRPSAVSARFQFPSNTRTEFLRELDPQDPYVRRLRCALQQQPGVPLQAAAQIGGCNEFN
ncbi:hormogonium polysaccharide biosynthesis protein HpsA [Synechococcus sp. W55.1]|uniref:hormogonium polysaccharide biosynthesis protein HpsA n=1 Tax=Synechococcus sp. W55.1 TaxID=2964512 RepID=UPI0039C11913